MNTPDHTKYQTLAFSTDERDHAQPRIGLETAATHSARRLDGAVRATTVIKRSNRRSLVLAGVAVSAVALAGGLYYARYIAPYESTDDAAIEGHVTSIASQVSGKVEQLLVQDNQEVKKGDLLLVIDPSDYEAKLSQARASFAEARSRLEQARAQLAADQAKVDQERANITSADADAARSLADLKRYQAVGADGVSQSQIDLAAAQAIGATAQVTVVHNREKAAEAQVALSQASIGTALADIQQSEAAVRQAELNVSYTKITAAADGRVTRRSVEEGAYVQIGQPLLAIVPHGMWVVANFKETQLAHMHVGQPVTIKVDAYPQLTFAGRVESFQAGTGSRFSLFPPENASGNFVKVVQRVPVKILFNYAYLAEATMPLSPGMSVELEVKVR